MQNFAFSERIKPSKSGEFKKCLLHIPFTVFCLMLSWRWWLTPPY